jgi:AAHS family 4-hydroxybenzoate transporter-like MFS transporter
MSKAKESLLQRTMDARPVDARLVAMLAMCALVMIIDGYDIAALPLALPYITRLWEVAPADFSVALSAVVLGLGAGALLVAPFGDRYGRRPLVIGSVLALALTTVATATATGVAGFVVWRLLTGMALGAALPNVTALVAEVAPRKIRATMITLVGCGVPIGGTVAGLIVPGLHGLGGWEMIFYVAGAGTLLMVPVLAVVLPESPKHLLTRRPGHPALEKLARRTGTTVEALLADARAQPAPDRPARLPVLQPLRREFWLATSVYYGLYTANAAILYMLASWVPTLLSQVDFSIAQASRMSAAVQFGGLVGGVVISWFLDRGRAVEALLSSYVLVIVALAAFSFIAPDPVVWGSLLLVAGGGVSGAHMAILAVGTSFYPPQMLSSAIGLSVAVARLGAIGGPMLGGWLIARGVGSAQFFLVLIVPVCLCIAGVLLIPAVKRSRGLAA